MPLVIVIAGLTLFGHGVAFATIQHDRAEQAQKVEQQKLAQANAQRGPG